MASLTSVRLFFATDSDICAGANLVCLIHVSRPRSIDWNICPVTTSLRRRYPSPRLLCIVVSLALFSSQISECVDAVAAWMKSNRLQLNPAKTEVLWCTTSRRRYQLPSTAMLIDGVPVTPMQNVLDLGMYLRRAASLPSASYVRSVNWYRWPHSRRWRSLSSTNGWTTGTARWLAFQRTSCADCSQLWTLRHGSSSISGAPITSPKHSSVYIGCVYRSESNCMFSIVTHHGTWGRSPLLLMPLVTTGTAFCRNQSAGCASSYIFHRR